MSTRLRLTAIALLLCAAHLKAASPKTGEGIKLFEAGKRSEARVALEAAARDDPKDALDGAVLWLEKAVALDATSSENQLWLGRAYGSQAIKANVFKQASLAGKVKTAFEKSVELDANNLDARFGVIDFYLQAPGIMGGSVEKAREQAARAEEGRTIARHDASRPRPALREEGHPRSRAPRVRGGAEDRSLFQGREGGAEEALLTGARASAG